MKQRRKGSGKELRAALKEKTSKQLAKRDARWQKKLERAEKKRDKFRADLKDAKKATKDARKELKALQRDTKKLLRMLNRFTAPKVARSNVRNETPPASSNTQATT